VSKKKVHTPKKKDRKPRKRPPKKTLGSRLKQLLMLSFALAALGCTAVVGVYLYYAHGLPDYRDLADYQPPQISRVYAQDGSIIGEFYEERRTLVDRSQIPEVLIQAILSAEDADFYSHKGLDYMGMARAVYNSVRAGRVTGSGSTITQQTVKNLLLTPKKSIRRKVRELILARRLEQHLSKDDILAIYLNAIYLGHGRYGVQEAAQYYFGKDASRLGLNESATLAGLIQSPERISPFKHPKRARQRRHYVLKQMVKNGHIQKRDADRIESQGFALRTRTKTSRDKFGWFVDEVYKRLLKSYTPKEIKRAGLKIHTTIDPIRQTAAMKSVQMGLNSLDKRQTYGRPISRVNDKGIKRWSKRQRKRLKGQTLKVGKTIEGRVLAIKKDVIELDLLVNKAELRRTVLKKRHALLKKRPIRLGDIIKVKIASRPQPGSGEPLKVTLPELPQAALIVIDNESRDVLAMVGGWNYAISKFNRSTRSKRQPGSAFKPFVWGAAIASRQFTAASNLLDAPETLRVYQGRFWQPRNYTRKFKGAISLRDALANSVNSIAVHLTEAVGIESVHQFAKNSGIKSKVGRGLSAALGSSEVRMIELVNGYSTIASSGHFKEPRLIRKIETSNREIKTPKQAQLGDSLSPDVTFIVRSLLRSVVTDGSGRGLKSVKRQVVGKTGTTNQARDAWFVGSLPDVSFATWVGFDNGRPLGRKESGSRTAVPIIKHYLDQAETDGPDWKSSTKGVSELTIVADGRLAQAEATGTRVEFFLNGTEPTDVAPLEGEIDENAFLMNPGSEAKDQDIKPSGGALNPVSDAPIDTMNLDLTPVSARKGKTRPRPAVDLSLKGSVDDGPQNRQENGPVPEEDEQSSDEDDDEDRPQ